MRETKVVGIVAMVLLAAATAGTAQGEDNGVAVGVTGDFFSSYVWRGQHLTDGWVFQPGASVSYAGVTAGVWGNLDLEDVNGEEGEFIEYDWYLDYSGQLTDVVGFSLGAIYYYFPSVGETTELYWGFNFDVPASPSVTVYHDIDAAEGTYVSAGVGHTFDDIFEIGADSPVALELGATIGWGDSSYNEFYWGPDDGEFNDLVLSAALPFELGGFSVTPSAHYVFLVGSDIQDADTYDEDNDIFYGGIGFAKEF